MLKKLMGSDIELLLKQQKLCHGIRLFVFENVLKEMDNEEENINKCCHMIKKCDLIYIIDLKKQGQTA